MALPTALSLQGRLEGAGIISLSMPTIIKGLGHGDRQGGVQPDIYSDHARVMRVFGGMSAFPSRWCIMGRGGRGSGWPSVRVMSSFGGDAPASLLALGQPESHGFLCGGAFSFLFNDKKKY